MYLIFEALCLTGEVTGTPTLIQAINKLRGYSPGGRVNKHLFTRLLIRAFSDVEKPFLFSDLAVKAAKSEN